MDAAAVMVTYYVYVQFCTACTDDARRHRLPIRCPLLIALYLMTVYIYVWRRSQQWPFISVSYARTPRVEKILRKEREREFTEKQSDRPRKKGRNKETNKTDK